MCIASERLLWSREGRQLPTTQPWDRHPAEHQGPIHGRLESTNRWPQFRASHRPHFRGLPTAADGAPLQTELLVWVLHGVITAAFWACCATLAGIKPVERRLTARLTMASDRRLLDAPLMAAMSASFLRQL